MNKINNADHALRGGSWNYDAYYTCCADRTNDYPRARSHVIGFRCVIKNKRENNETKEN